MSSAARAIANSDIVHIAWSVDSPIRDCAGFVIHRQPADGSAGWEPLRSLIEFEDERVDDAARPTTVTPVTKFQWRDFLERCSRDRAVRYEIVAVRKEAGAFEPVPGVQPLLTNDVTPTEHLTDGVEVYFNRGILATQALVKLLTPYGGSSVGALQKALLKAPGRDPPWRDRGCGWRRATCRTAAASATTRSSQPAGVGSDAARRRVPHQIPCPARPHARRMAALECP